MLSATCTVNCIKIYNEKYELNMKLSDLGYNSKVEKHLIESNPQCHEIGRIISEHKERYVVKTEKGEFESEITGSMRFTAVGREDFPAVGDWVTLTVYDSYSSIIHSIIPRFSTISRQTVGQHGEIQIIATNVDYALLVQAVDRDFNINRLERYLTICNASHVDPIIVLTKTDLISHEQVSELSNAVRRRVKGAPIIPVSNINQNGFHELVRLLEAGKTYCMLGSSGVGKSTLLNNLYGEDRMKTDSISTSTNKGRHVSSHRELMVLKTGGILIDNPGMREVGITDTATGLEMTFDTIVSLGHECKFNNCTHTCESGCAVIQAVESGELDSSLYDNFLKLEREKAHFEMTVADSRKKSKQFSKMVKNYKEGKNKSKF